MFRVEHIEYLIGLAAVPLLVVTLSFLLSWKKNTAAKIGDEALVRQLVRNFSSWRFLLKSGLALLAFVVIILGAGNPQKPGSMQNVKRKGVDVMLVLDVSKSMLARDIKPSRLERAKQLLLRMVDKLDNDRIGLVLFAGRPYMQMPLTTDHGAARMYIQQAGPDAVPTQGTVIAEALQMANMAFNTKERKYKSILLISDGEDHDPDALKEAKKLAQDGVMINTVGIGTPDGSPIVDPATGELKKDDQGNVVMSKLNEAELQQLSAVTSGQYIRLDNVDDALITMTQQLENAEKKSMTDAELIDYKSYFQWFLAAALLLLVLEFFLSERRMERVDRRERPQKKTGAAAMAAPLLLLLIVLASAVLPASAQTANSRIRSGNRYYKKKEVDKSIQQYQAAVQQAPSNPAANYNLGNAQFRKNQYDEAAKSYDATIRHSQDKKMKENGYYNKGVAMIRQKKLQEGIDAWKQALKLDAADADARDNLERALRQLKQQQQQQNQQNQKKDQKDQQQKKDQKKDQDQQQQQQPKPQPSRLNKQEVEQLLKALEQKESDLHNKMQQNKMHTPNQPDKDW
ncbi:MAG TPA: VWA domain-containing protein [Puia sp.]|nr:VWA domain-containing protein [Puia sp.]